MQESLSLKQKIIDNYYNYIVAIKIKFTYCKHTTLELPGPSYHHTIIPWYHGVCFVFIYSVCYGMVLLLNFGLIISQVLRTFPQRSGNIQGFGLLKDSKTVV